MADVTAQEQLMLELVNRARMDPLAEAARFGIDLNQGLAAGTITSAAKQVLAMNDLLVASSRNHSSWMLAADVFSHTGSGGSDAGQRMAAAGYTFTGSWTWGENIAWSGTSPGPIDATTSIVSQHRGLFLSSGHRTNILGDAYREIGVGQQIGNFLSGGTDWSASMVTQNFAKSGANLFLTGVVYTDSVNDDFYGIGEGVGGVTVSVAGGPSDVSNSAGGYEIGLAPGPKTVTIGGVTLGLAVGASNVKLDLVNGTEIWTNATITSLSGAAALTLLGIENIGATGGGTAERLTGNVGNNALAGGGGADTLDGGAGNDTLDGGAGGDVLTGGAGTNLLTGGADDDIYYVSGASDVVVENVGGGADTVFTYVDMTLAANVESLFSLGSAGVLVGNGLNNTLIGGYATVAQNINGGDGADYISGSAARDTLLGGEGADIILGRAGNDSMAGGNGDDSYYVEDAGDEVIEAAGAAAGTGDIVYTAVTYTLTANVETGFTHGSATALTGNGGDNALLGVYSAAGVTLNGLDGADVLYGSNFADTLNGGAGADTFFGLLGLDACFGGDGNDTYFLEQAGDSAAENANEGVDTVYAAFDYTLLANFETLFIYGAATAGTGNGAANTLIGSYRPGVSLAFDGAGGADRIISSTGDDVIAGGAGDDTLTGGGGNDVFLYNAAGLGVDTITDFAAGPGLGDRVNVQGVFANLAAILAAATGAGGTTTITASPGNQIVLAGVATALLNADDFIF